MTEVLANSSAPFYSLVLAVDQAAEELAPMLRRRQNPVRLPRSVPLSGFMAKSDYPAPPGEWVSDAACQGRRMFYTVISAHSNRVNVQEQIWEQESINVCLSCPVLDECRTWALQDIDPAVDHIAGGMTPKQRWEYRRGSR